MKKLLVLSAMLLFAGSAFAQSTTVSGTITDASGQAWVSGTYSFVFRVAPTNPSAQYYWNGAPFSKTQTFAGALDSSGHFSQSLPSNTSITPSGSSWDLTVCPISKGNAQCFTVQSISVSGATMDLSSSVVPPAISIDLAHPAYPFVVAYKNQEITTAPIGGIYYDFTLSHYFICEGISPTGLDQAYGTCTLWVEICQDGDTTCGGGGAAAIYQHNGTLVGQRPKFNVIDGSNVTLTMTDDNVNDRVNLTIAASGGGGGSNCSTTVTGLWATTPQTCAGEKVIQGIAGNPTIKNFVITPASDQTAENTYFGDAAGGFTSLSPTFFGDDPLTDAFHVNAEFDRAQDATPMWAALLAYNEDHTGGPSNAVLGLRCIAALTGSNLTATVQACESEGYNTGTASVNVLDAYSAYVRTADTATTFLQADFYGSRNGGIPGTTHVRNNHGLFIEFQGGIGTNNYEIYTVTQSLNGPAFFVNADSGHVNVPVLESARPNPLCYSTTSLDTNATFVIASCSFGTPPTSNLTQQQFVTTTSTCTAAAGTYNKCNFNITWPQAWADTNAIVVCQVAGGIPQDGGLDEAYYLFVGTNISTTQTNILIQNNRGSTVATPPRVNCSGGHT